jgi:hypothetical protein
MSLTHLQSFLLVTSVASSSWSLDTSEDFVDAKHGCNFVNWESTRIFFKIGIICVKHIIFKIGIICVERIIFKIGIICVKRIIFKIRIICVERIIFKIGIICIKCIIFKIGIICRISFNNFASSFDLST